MIFLKLDLAWLGQPTTMSVPYSVTLHWVPHWKKATTKPPLVVVYLLLVRGTSPDG
jgi:hypothetical protein